MHKCYTARISFVHCTNFTALHSLSCFAALHVLTLHFVDHRIHTTQDSTAFLCIHCFTMAFHHAQTYMIYTRYAATCLYGTNWVHIDIHIGYTLMYTLVTNWCTHWYTSPAWSKRQRLRRLCTSAPRKARRSVGCTPPPDTDPTKIHMFDQIPSERCPHHQL